MEERRKTYSLSAHLVKELRLEDTESYRCAQSKAFPIFHLILSLQFKPLDLFDNNRSSSMYLPSRENFSKIIGPFHESC